MVLPLRRGRSAPNDRGYREAVRALIVQHEPDGPAGLVGEHLRRRGYELAVLPVLREGSTASDAPFPDAAAYDLVVPLGSKHSVYDRATVGTWIERELAMLDGAVVAGVPVLGICFGAQALTAALGGQVERSPEREIGWVEPELAEGAPEVLAGPWFTWHEDRCVLPPAAVELARSRTAVQAFRAGRCVGVQFHPEVTADVVRAWVESCPPGYLAERGVVPRELAGSFASRGGGAAERTARLVDWFVDEVAG